MRSPLAGAARFCSVGAVKASKRTASHEAETRRAPIAAATGGGLPAGACSSTDPAAHIAGSVAHALIQCLGATRPGRMAI
mgnify:CR=1 FL=1